MAKAAKDFLKDVDIDNHIFLKVGIGLSRGWFVTKGFLKVAKAVSINKNRYKLASCGPGVVGAVG